MEVFSHNKGVKGVKICNVQPGKVFCHDKDGQVNHYVAMEQNWERRGVNGPAPADYPHFEAFDPRTGKVVKVHGSTRVVVLERAALVLDYATPPCDG